MNKGSSTAGLTFGHSPQGVGHTHMCPAILHFVSPGRSGIGTASLVPIELTAKPTTLATNLKKPVWEIYTQGDTVLNNRLPTLPLAVRAIGMPGSHSPSARSMSSIYGLTARGLHLPRGVPRYIENMNREAVTNAISDPLSKHCKHPIPRQNSRS